MPTRKTVDKTVSEPAAASADVVKNRAKAAPAPSKAKTPAATHKRATKKTTIEESAVQAVPVPAASHDDVAKLAYSYWAARGFCGGSPVEDWLRAERELGL